MSGTRIRVFSVRLSSTLLGVWLFLLATGAGGQEPVDLPALQRAIVQAEDVRRELGEALGIMRRQTEERGIRLAEAEQTLTAADVDIDGLRQARLDIQTLEARRQTLSRQLDRIRDQLRRVNEAIDADVARLDAAGKPVDLEIVSTEVALRMRRELQDINAELEEMANGLLAAVTLQLGLAREYLALLQARFDPGVARASGDFADDPRVRWLDRIISSLSHNVVSLTKESTVLPGDRPEQRARKQLLQIEADETALRSLLRTADRELIRIEYRLTELEALRDEGAIPFGVLRAARQELGAHLDYLRERLTEIERTYRTLEAERDLVGQKQASEDLPQHDSAHRLIDDMEQALDLHLEDLVALEQRVTEVHASYEAVIGEAYRASLLDFQALPLESEGWQRLAVGLGRLPEQLYQTLSDALRWLGQQLARADQQAWARIAGAALLLIGAVLLLRHWLARLIAADPDANLARPAAALKRGLPALLPAALWTVLALVLGIDQQWLYLVLTLLLVWPIAGFVLALTRGTSGAGTSKAHRHFYSRLRWVAVLVAVLAGLIILVESLQLPPGVAGLIDRAAMLCLLLGAYPTVQLRAVLMSSEQSRQRGWLRLLARLAWVVPVVLAGVAVIGLVGYLNLAWAIIIHLAWLVVISGVLALLLGLLWDWIDALGERWRNRSLEQGEFWVKNFLYPLARLATLGLLVLGGRVLLDIYNWDAETPGVRHLLGFGNARLMSFGESELTVLNLLLAILLVWLVFWVGGWSRQVSFHLIYQRIRDIGIRQSLATFTQYAVIVLGILITLRLIGFDLTALTVFAATLGVGIGFGLQNIVNNFLSGILLLAERPLRLTDIVDVAGQTGTVTRIGIRSLTIKNFDQQEVIIPNSSVISDSFTNWTRTDGYYRQVLMIGISYDDDPQQAMELIRGILQDYKAVCRYPAYLVTLHEFADSAVVFRVQYFIDLNGAVGLFDIRSEVLRRIWYAFKEQGIRIPYPQRDVHMRVYEPSPEPSLLPAARPGELPAS